MINTEGGYIEHIKYKLQSRLSFISIHKALNLEQTLYFLEIKIKQKPTSAKVFLILENWIVFLRVKMVFDIIKAYYDEAYLITWTSCTCFKQ